MILLIISFVLCGVPLLIALIITRLGNKKVFKTPEPTIPKMLSDLENDVGYIDSVISQERVWKIKLACYVISVVAASLIIIFGGIAINKNTFVSLKKQRTETYRTILVTKYEYYQNYGTEYIKSETAVAEYSKLMNQIGEFNNDVYYVNLYKDNPWIGLFTDKGYVGVEPINIKGD